MHIFMARGEDLPLFREAIPESVYNPALMLVLGYEDEKLCGLIATELGNPGDLHIVHIMVSEDGRRAGIGRSLISYLNHMASAMGIGRILCNYVRDEDTEDLDGFFEATGFTVASSTGIFTMDISKSAEILADHEDELKEISALSLAELTTARYNSFRSLLRKLKESKSGESGLFIDPGPKERYVPEISYVVYNKHKEPAGLILFRDTDMGYVLEYLCVFGANKGGYMLALFAASALFIMENWSFNDMKKPLLFHGYNKSVAAIAGKLGIKTKKIGDSVWMEKEL